jgi:hypothetical protein
MMEYFKHLPPHMRIAALEEVRGRQALRFPSGYAMKIKSKSCVLINPIDDKGMVVMLHDKSYIMIEFIEYLKKHSIEHEIVTLA